jgi:hypothetical protein
MQEAVMFELWIKKIFGRVLHSGFAVVLIIAAGYTAIVFLEQTAGWLKTGEWLGAPISSWLRAIFGMSDFHTEWVGFNKIIEWCLQLHVGALMFLVAIGCFVTMGWGCMLAEEAELELKRRRELR